MGRSRSDNIVDVLNMFAIAVFCLFCVLPMVHMFALSFSGNRPIMSGEVTFWPVEWTWGTYEAVLGDFSMIRSLLFTIILVVTYTAMTLAATIMAAYPLSRRDLKGKHAMFAVIIVTMFFNPGIIPHYLLVKQLNMLDTPWALILPVLINAFLLIILKTSFSQLPVELEDAAWMVRKAKGQVRRIRANGLR